MSDLATLLSKIQQEAQRQDFPLDYPVYQSAKKDALTPILFAGSLKSQVCFFGRDLGRDEVHAGQPLIGAAGTLVREGFYQALHGHKSPNREALQTVCERLLLTNTVPYKPPGNKAYSPEVKERFRPFIEELLVLHWQGKQIITLGTEAFKWFAPYGRKGEVNEFFSQDNRFSSHLTLTLRAKDDQGVVQQRSLTVMPLPHPSPLNQRYYSKFPHMLQQRLQDMPF